MVTRFSLPPAVVVVAGATLINFVYAGVFYCTGLFFYDFMTTFQASRQATALTLSLLGGSLYISGLFAGPLIIQYGARVVAVVGAILSSAGLTMSAFAPSLAMLYVTFGVLTGFSQGFLMTAGAVCVQQHTNRRRVLAGGISYVGSALGGLIFPFIFRWGQSVYGWRGTLLLLAGLHFNTLPAAMLLLPAPPVPNDPHPSPTDKDQLPIDKETKLSSTNKNQLPKDLQPSSMNKDQPAPGLDTQGSSCLRTDVQKGPMEDPLEQQDLLAGQNNGVGVGDPPRKGVERTGVSRVVHKLRAARRAMVAGGLPAMACIFMYLFRFIGLSAIHTFFPMKATSLGLHSDTAAYFMSVLSTGELVGRVLTAPIACLHTLLPLVFFVMATLTYSVLQVVLGTTSSLPTTAGTIGILGVAAGVITCCGTTVVRDTVGLQNLAWVLGLAYTAAGIGHFTAVQLLALVWEETDNVSLVFLISGISMAFAGLTILLNKIVQIRKSQSDPGGLNGSLETRVTTVCAEK